MTAARDEFPLVQWHEQIALATVIVDLAAAIGIDTRSLSIQQRSQNSLSLGSGLFGRPVLEHHTIGSGATEFALKIVRRQEDESIQPRHTDFLHGLLGLEQGRKGFGFAISQQDRIVFGDRLAVVRAGPRSRIARDLARPTLDLDQPESLLGQDQQIHFVDGPVVALELEIRPGPIRDRNSANRLE